MDKKPKDKIDRCRYSHPSMRNLGSYHCVVEGWEDEQVRTVAKEDCESCEKFKSRYIEYPLTIQGIETRKSIRKVSGIRVVLCAKFVHAEKNTRERHTLEFTLGIYRLVLRLRMMKILAF